MDLSLLIFRAIVGAEVICLVIGIICCAVDAWQKRRDK